MLKPRRHRTSTLSDRVNDYLRINGPSDATAIAKATGLNRANVSTYLNAAPTITLLGKDGKRTLYL